MTRPDRLTFAERRHAADLDFCSSVVADPESTRTDVAEARRVLEGATAVDDDQRMRDNLAKLPGPILSRWLAAMTEIRDWGRGEWRDERDEKATGRELADAMARADW